MTMNLGNFLKNARKRNSLTLRIVEEKIGISNAYLSQLENGKIIKPSPVILNKLADLYDISYERLMSLAGYPFPKKSNRIDESTIKSRLGDYKDITDEEEKKLKEYLEFLRSKKRL